MFQRSTLELSQAGGVGALVLDYLSAKDRLRTLYSYPPTAEGFRSFLSQQPFATTDRKILTDVLRKQATQVSNTSDKSKKNIELLSDHKTFTVTTGHQLCLFTGPLYFIYKIATTIKLARQLQTISPGNNFVPVFWLASEDHDFAEVNHFNTPNGTVTWESGQTGAVGRFSTNELETILPEVEKLFGGSDNGNYLTELFRNAYPEQKNLSIATRFIINAIFGNEGVVVIDADDETLKSTFRAEMQKDLFEQLTYREIQKTVESIKSPGYDIQVSPRQTNLFLLTDDKRIRIDRNKDGNFVAGDQKFTSAEIQKLLDDSPEKFSPNVSLRGLYQQKILPNIAYIGGPGELSYWLEYKGMFDAYKIAFPVLVPRCSFTIIDKENSAKLERYKLSVANVFRPYDEVTKKYLAENGKTSSADKEKAALNKIYDDLRDKVSKIDKSLLKHVSAMEQKHLNSIDGLLKKTDRAFRRSSDIELQRIKSIQELLRPGRIPQERHFNFSTFFLKYGNSIIVEILKNADPFEYAHVILKEQE